MHSFASAHFRFDASDDMRTPQTAALAAIFLCLMLWGGLAYSATLTTLYTFTGPPNDGARPIGALYRDAAGHLFGTTELGGSTSSRGTLFEITAPQQEQILHIFSGAPDDGDGPDAPLLRDNLGNFYGTAQAGGTYNQGTVYEYSSNGFSLLYSFQGNPDGASPFAGLTMEAKSTPVRGNLYGTTEKGGVFGLGTVFQLDPTNKESVLYSFTGQADGYYPVYSGVVRDQFGNLYGTTFEGGNKFGVVFEISPFGKDQWIENTLHAFGDAPDGEEPQAGLIRDTAGNLYGTTINGGLYSGGTVFKIDTSQQETIIHNFRYAPPDYSDGQNPYSALVMDSHGNFFGTTIQGGAHGHGTVFELQLVGSEYVESVLYSFTGKDDGDAPYSALIIGSDGNLYGTTSRGGFVNDQSCSGGCGTVFKLVP